MNIWFLTERNYFINVRTWVIKTRQSKDTSNIEYKTQNEDKQNHHKKDEQHLGR